jgi:hypothetical protein
MNTPEKGFYYHCKRKPEDAFNYAAYEVMGSAFSTESGGNVHSDDPNDFIADEVVVYRPLFKEALTYTAGRDFWIRPIKMFFSKTMLDGKEVDRFQKITDPELLDKLEKIRDEMYN